MRPVHWIAPGFAALLLAAGMAAGAAPAWVPSAQRPPEPRREFRGAWVATVKNIDWPSRPGLSSAQQQAELIAILDQAARLRLNAILLQVRPMCDALYVSGLEPWSEYLTGQMGRAPWPYYDPLAFAVEQAHARGLELHAWFNPFRARHNTGFSSVSGNHISKTRPSLVKSYGPQLWLDPGEPEVHRHTLAVILDVVRRYDIDGVHLDDYFYPYPEKDAAGRTLDFPDAASWKRYRDAGGRLARADWRRQNVDRFVERLYLAVKETRPQVKVGLSPFGIWRPGHPPQIRGFDAYERLHADARKWLAEGWVDYFTPQLYWRIDQREQSYPALLGWWAAQNPKARHLWPGNSASRIGPDRGADEILRQLDLTRRQPGAGGNVFWSFKPLLQNRGGLADLLRTNFYAAPALAPASPWLDSNAPPRPVLVLTNGPSGAVEARWSPAAGETPWLWLLQQRVAGQWTTRILPFSARHAALEPGTTPDLIALRAVDRCGNTSAPAVMERVAAPARASP